VTIVIGSPSTTTEGWLSTRRVRIERLLSDVAVTQPGPPANGYDFALVVLLVVASAMEIVFLPFDYWQASIVPTAVAYLLVPFRRQKPLATLVVAFVAQFATDVVMAARDELAQTTWGHAIAAFVLVYALFRWSRPRHILLGSTSVVAVIYASEQIVAGGEGRSASEVALFMIPFLLLAMFALAMRYRARLAENYAARQRLEERQLIARELHDAVAHHVSAIAVQAQAAQFVAESNPHATVQAIGHIEAIANQAIDEMRRMVGVLRSDDDDLPAVASTSLLDLVEPNSRSAVILTGQSDLSSLPTSVASAVYRIAQESITNARRHSRGLSTIVVDLSVDGHHARLDVINDGTPVRRIPGNGFGVVGMTERVQTLDGAIDIGPTKGGGWKVRASIPLGATHDESRVRRGAPS